MLFSLQIGCCHYLGEGDLNTDFISGQPCSHSTDCRNRRSHLVETAKELINRQGDENNRMDKCAFLITPNPVNALNSCPGMMAAISLWKIRRTLSFIYEIVQTQALVHPHPLRDPSQELTSPLSTLRDGRRGGLVFRIYFEPVNLNSSACVRGLDGSYSGEQFLRLTISVDSEL